MVGWLGGWVRNAGNKAKLSPASAGTWAELGNIVASNPLNERQVVEEIHSDDLLTDLEKLTITSSDVL